MFEHKIDEHVSLKLLRVQDAERLFTLTDSSKEHLRQWLPWVDFTTSSEDTKAFIEGTLKQFASNQGFQAGIWYQGELTGVIGLHNINWGNKSTSIGYWLGEKYQGKGLMTRACSSVIDYLFKELNLNRVEIRVATTNKKSGAIPIRLGFQEEGRIRKAEWLSNHYVDHIVYGMLAEEWQQK
ncbi:MAG: GNAT family N-acetyltransferase [Bacillaceae bacterium]